MISQSALQGMAWQIWLTQTLASFTSYLLWSLILTRLGNFFVYRKSWISNTNIMKIKQLKFLLIVPLIFLYSFSLLSFPFLFPFPLLPFFLVPPFLFFPRWDKKTWRAEKTRVRPCYTQKLQLKTIEHRRLRRQHHKIPLAFYHRSSYHKPRESE